MNSEFVPPKSVTLLRWIVLHHLVLIVTSFGLVVISWNRDALPLAISPSEGWSHQPRRKSWSTPSIQLSSSGNAGTDVGASV